MKKVVLSCLLFSLLFGCSSTKETKVCSIASDHYKETMEIEYKDDEVLKQTLKQKIDLKTFYKDKAEAISYYKELKKIYDFDGVSLTYTIKKKNIKTVIVLDFEKANINELYDNKLVVSKDGFMGYTELLNSFQAQGYECKQKEIVNQLTISFCLRIQLYFLRYEVF